MKIYKTNAEVESDVKDGILAIAGDVTFECSITINASIIAGDITARDINARNITARDINARNITAWDITAEDILYYAFCSTYQNIKCKSIKATREKHSDPVCLEGKLEIPKEDEV